MFITFFFSMVVTPIFLAVMAPLYPLMLAYEKNRGVVFINKT